MKYGITTLTWTAPFTDEHLPILSRVKELGFDGVEIFLQDPPRQLDYGHVRAEAARLGLDVSVCVMMTKDRDPSGARAEARRSGVAYLKQCVDAVTAMGGTIVCGPIFGAQDYYGGERGAVWSAEERRQRRAWCVESLQEAARYAGSKGARLMLEPLNRFETSLINLSAQALEVVEAVGASNLYVHLDTYHMNIDERRFGEAIAVAGARLGHFHACESDRGTPGTGHVPWAEVAEALRQVGFDGYIVLEPFLRTDRGIGAAPALWRPPSGPDDPPVKQGLDFLKHLMGD